MAMNEIDLLKITEEFGIYGNIILLVEGSQAADLAAGMEYLSSLYKSDKSASRLLSLDVSKRLWEMFRVYRQDYDEENLPQQELVARYQQNLTSLSLLASEIKPFLSQLNMDEFDNDNIDKAHEWIGTMNGTLEDIAERNRRMNLLLHP